MKKHILLLGLFLSTFLLSYAQESTSACKTFDNAHQLYCNKKYVDAAKLLSQNYEKEFASIDSHRIIKLGMANAYFEGGKMKQASKIYQSIVDIEDYPTEGSVYLKENCFSSANRCPSFMLPKRLLENQHEANVMMAKASLKKRKYEKALGYIKNADLYYRYWYGCGTTDLETDLELSLLYAKYYEKTKMPDSAISKLVKNILEPAALPVPYYDEVVKEASRLINKQYSKSEIVKIMNEAIDNLYFVSFDSHHGESESRTYYIRLFGVEIKAAPEYLFEHNKDLEEVKDFIRNTEFFKGFLD